MNGASKKLVGLAAAVVVVTACSSGDAGDDTADNPRSSAPPSSPTAVITESPTPEDEPSTDPFAPNVGETALTIGETRVGREVETTLKAVQYPLPPVQYRDADPGNVWVGLDLEQCISQDAEVDPDAPFYSTYNGDWAVLDPQGYEYGGDGSYWDDWPRPKFPESVTMNPGRCVKGTIALQVPKGTKIRSLVWRPEGVETAEWLPK